MPIHEWSVMFTDFLLAALCVWLWRRLRPGTTRAPGAASAIRAGLAASASAALVGGTRHGMGPWLPDEIRGVLWFVSYAGILLAGTFMLWGILRAHVYDTGARCAYRTMCGLKFWLAAILLLLSQKAMWVAVSCAADTLVIGAVGVISYRRWWVRDIGRWLLVGAISSLAAGVVQLGWPLGTAGVLHNDVCHLLLMPTMYAYYRAVSVMREKPDAAVKD